MTRHLASRLVQAVLVVALVAVATFVIVQAAPGGPALLADPKLSRAERAAIARELGLDDPAPVRFVRWVTRAAHGDLGRSFLYQAPVGETIRDRLPATASLAGTALLIALVVAVPLGLHAGAAPGTAIDRLATRASVVALSVPVFWLGVMLILVFAVRLRWLPAGGATAVGATDLIDRLRHLVLPAVTLALALSAELYRYTRAAVLQVAGTAWWRAGRARGLPPHRLLWRHAGRHAFASLAAVVGLQLPRLVGGAAITETVFSWPGMGRLGVEAALARDYPLVLAVTLVVAVAVSLASLLADLLLLAADPRLRRA